MRRILFLTESFHPVLGGGETHIRELSRRLAASGMPASVLTRRGDAGWPCEELLEGVRVLRVPPAGPGRSGKYRMLPRVLERLVRERRSYDVVVVRGMRVLGVPALLAARWLAKAVVLQAELNGEMSGEAYTWGTRLERGPARVLVDGMVRLRNRLLRDADGFVAMSRAIAREFRSAGVAADRIAYIPHGVDTQRFRPATPQQRLDQRARLGIGADEQVVVYTGRLLKGKGLETLVAAFADVLSRRPRARLLLVGSGAGQSLSVEQALQAQVEAAGIAPSVRFVGRVEDVVPWLQASDVFAFPSVFEALGLALVEAAACGLPAVATRTGGIVDVIEDGRSGVLVGPGDARELAQALTGLLQDPVRRGVLGARARILACERFDLEDSVARYRAFFSEVGE